MNARFFSDRDLRNRISLGLLVVIAGLFWITREPTPSVEIVDGVYASTCCNSITINHGAFLLGRQRVPFTLQTMKYRLQATPNLNITVNNENDAIAVKTDEAHRIYILFGADKRGFTLLGPRMHDYHFRR